MTYNENELVKTYVGFAEEYGRASEAGEHEKTNRAHDALQALASKIISLSHAFETLAIHSNPWVRLWTAWHFHEKYPKQAERLLEELGQDTSQLVGFDARRTLQKFRETQGNTRSG